MNSPLPPLGQITPEQYPDVASHLSDLARESAVDRNPWCAEVDRNRKLFVYGTENWPTTKMVFPDIRNAVIALTNIQNGEPLHPLLEPVETGDPGEIWFVGPDGSAQGPIPPDQAMMLQQPKIMVDPMSGQPMIDAVTGQPAIEPGIPPEQFVTIDDELVADTEQTVLDRLWERARLDRRFRAETLRNNIDGWGLPLFEFDDDRKQVILRETSVRQVYVDPTCEDIEDAAYAGIDMVKDAGEAKSLWPHLSAKIDQHAKDGNPDRPSGADFMGHASERTFERPTVTMRVFWLRYQPVPQTPEEAVGRGIIEAREVLDEPTGIPGATAPSGGVRDRTAGAEDNAAGESAGLDPVSPEDAGARLEDGAAELSPMPAGAGTEGTPALGQVAPRIGFFAPGTDQELTPDSPDWPTRLVIRQITVVCEEVVDDRECEHHDIPLLHFVCIPIPGQPWGVGEPFSLRPAQEARNRIIDAIVQHTERFKTAQGVIPESMYEMVQSIYGRNYLKPGESWIIPDALLTQWQGKVDFFHDPPDVPETSLQVAGLLKQELSDQSGHTDVMRGIMPSKTASGKSIELLQQGSMEVVGYKAQRNADVAQRLTHLILHCQVHRLSAEDIHKIVSKYPLPVIARIHERARELEWNVRVTAQGGTTQQRQAAKKAEALEIFGVVDPLTGEPAMSVETLRERLTLDHQQERQRMADAMQMAAERAAATQPPAEGGDGGSESGPPQ